MARYLARFVTEGEAPPSNRPSASVRIRRAVETYPEASVIALYAAVSLAALAAGYWAIFTQFAFYDDEGTLLVTVKAFLHGDTLYKEIWSVYGPFYYEVFGAFFKLTGSAVTTDASRLIVLIVWVGTSLLFGVVSQRLTRSVVLGVSGMIAAFAGLGVLISEPMHPQGLCVLLLAAIVLVVATEPRRRVLAAGGGAGFLIGALLLTKVNLGLFAIAALAVAAVLSLESPRWLRWARWPVVVAFLAMPLAIVARDLNLGWVRELLVLELLAAAAVVVAATPLRSSRLGSDARVLRWLLAAVAGFSVAFVAILVVALLTGPSLGDIYDGIVRQAFGIRDVLKVQLAFPAGQAVDWAVAALAGAAISVWVRKARGVSPLWSGALRAAAGVAIWLSIAHIAPVRLGSSSGNPDLVPLLLAWVAVIPPVGIEETAYRRFARLALALLAVAETLQVYPVAGSQMGIASVIFVPVGAICLGDALTELQAWRASSSAAPSRLAAIPGIVGVGLASILVLNAIVLPGATNLVNYRNQPSLRLPGAELLHLSQPDDETYTGLVGLLHQFRCTTFIGYPSVPSLYLWSGIESPKPQVPNAWMKALRHDQQQQVVEQMKASPRPCVISNGEHIGFYIKPDEPIPAEPLVEYVLHGFTPVTNVYGYQFMLPIKRADAFLSRSS